MAAGDETALPAIGRWLRDDKHLTKAQLDITGYWRRQPDQPSENDLAGLDVMGSTMAQHLKMDKLAGILSGFAIRAAVTIGLPAALESGPRTLAEIGEMTHARGDLLAKLLRYLVTLEIVDADSDGSYRLTGFGTELNDEDLADELDLAADHAQRELFGLLGLLDATGTTESPDHPAQAHHWLHFDEAQTRLSDPAIVADRVADDASKAAYLAAPLAESAVFDDLTSVSIRGLGAAVIASALVNAHDGLRARVCADQQAELDALRATTAPHRRLSYEVTATGIVGPQMDAVLLVNALNGMSDAQGARYLSDLASDLSPSGRILVLTEVFDAYLAYPHDYAEDLVDFGLSGGGSRDRAEYEALFTAAGLRQAGRSTIGWGFTLFALTLSN